MRDAGGGGLTYEVVVDELGRAARDVDAVTQSAAEGVLEALPSTIADFGNASLATAFADFCARWDAGLSHLVGDSRAMADRLRLTAQSYTREDDEAARRLRASPWGTLGGAATGAGSGWSRGLVG